MNLITFISLVNFFNLITLLQRTITTTADGSHTVSIPEAGLTYHSQHGAVRESMHVFAGAGLKVALARLGEGELRVFEMGFGTGLNAWLTALAAAESGRQIVYTAVEKYPLLREEFDCLNYPERTGQDGSLFAALHEAAWNEPAALSPFFTLLKKEGDLLTMPSPALPFHLVYFDAFAPDAQPELWTAEVFSFLKENTVSGTVLTTYCSKGSVRRAMQAAGWRVEKIPGPPGKREMVRAFAD